MAAKLTDKRRMRRIRQGAIQEALAVVQGNKKWSPTRQWRHPPPAMVQVELGGLVAVWRQDILALESRWLMTVGRHSALLFYHL